MPLFAQENGVPLDLQYVDGPSPFNGLSVSVAVLLWFVAWIGLRALLRNYRGAVAWTAIGRWFPTGMTLLYLLPFGLDGLPAVQGVLILLNLPALLPALPVFVAFPGPPLLQALLGSSVVVWVTWHALVLWVRRRHQRRPLPTP